MQEDYEEITVKLLVQLKNETDPRTRIAFLKQLRSKNATPGVDKQMIIEMMLDDPHAGVRIHAAAMHEEKVKMLIEMFSRQHFVSHRQLIIRLLAEIDDPHVETFLLGALKMPDRTIIHETINAIQYCHDGMIIMELKKILETYPESDQLRKDAVKAIARLKKNNKIGNDGWLSVSEKDDSGALSLDE